MNTNKSERKKDEKIIELLAHLHGEGWFEVFTAFESENKKPRARAKPANLQLLDLNGIRAENSRKRGVWFTVNSVKGGKRAKAMVYRLNAIVAEKDFKGSRSEINDKKADFLKFVLSLQLKPTVIIETKNGNHLCWSLEEGTITDVEQYESLQQAIQENLGCDARAIGAERLWRLPGFDHWKDGNDPFRCRIVHADYSKRYTYTELVRKYGGKKKVAAIKKKRAIGQYSGKPIQLDSFKGFGDINDIQRGCQVFGDLQSKSNPDHVERLALVWTYLNIGQEGLKHFREIARNWNDYDEEVTESNIEYALKRGYQAPTCDWLISRGICQGRCMNIRNYRKPVDLYFHPVNFLPVPFRNRSTIDINELQVLPDHIALTDNIVAVLENHGQIINAPHRQSLMLIAQVVSTPLYQDKPIAVPAVPGLGKTLFIIELIKYRLNAEEFFGAVIVVERQSTIDEITKLLNDAIPAVGLKGLFGMVLEPVLGCVYALKGYSPDYCKKGYPRYKPSQCKTCDVPVMECRVKYNFFKQMDYPIVVISHSRLFQMSDKDDLLQSLSYWRSGGSKHKRELLLIDERPKLVENVATDSTMWDTLLTDVKQYTPECYPEVLSGVNLVRDFYSLSSDYEAVDSINPEFTWSTSFSESWADNYLGDYPEYPGYLSSIISEGGLYCKQDHTVITTHYSNTYWQYYSTFIYDGTASIDLDYRDESFYFLDVPQLRPYTNLTLNVCMEASLSKTFYAKNPGFVERFCEDIKDIAQTGKTYVVCYKDYESQYEECLEGERNISIEHYGNTRGANHLIDNINLVCTGILNKGEPYYLSKAMAINEVAPNYEVVTTDKVRRFKDASAESVKVYEMVTELVQEIFRTQLRNHSSDAEVNVYLCTRDLNLVKALQDYFTGCQLKRDWHPKALFSARGLFRQFVEEHGDEHKTKSKLVKAFLDQGHTLDASDIIDVLEVDKSNAARYLR